MSSRNRSKAKINISKPELPPFLQRMKEQIVANEDAERKERSERKRKDRPDMAGDLDDDPTIVKINDDDLTEEEYKRMKTEMETQYKLDSDGAKAKPSELDVDSLIQTIQEDKSGSKEKSSRAKASVSSHHDTKQSSSKLANSSKQKSSKKLSYGSSDEESEEDD